MNALMRVILAVILTIGATQKPICQTSPFHDYCFGYDLMGIGVYDPSFIGDTIYVDSTLSISLDTFFTTTGIATFGTLTVMDASTLNFGNALSGNVFFSGNVNYTFHFNQDQNNPIQRVTLNYWDGGGNINFALNDHAKIVVENPSDLPEHPYPGVTVNVIPDSDPNSGIETGLIVIESIQAIHSLTLGGQEFATDNICVQFPRNCEFQNLIVTAILPCDSDGHFYVNIYADYIGNPVDNQFIASLSNGQVIGRFNTGDLPLIHLGPFSTWDPFLEFEVRSLDGECSAGFILANVNCNFNCSISDIEANVNLCDVNGEFWMDLNMDYDNTSDSFNLRIEGKPVGTYLYSDLPLSIGPLTDTFSTNPTHDAVDWNISITDAGIFGCSESIAIHDTIYCNSPCNLGLITVDTVYCHFQADSFDMLLDIDYANSLADSFTLKVSDVLIGIFAFSDLPMHVRDIPNLGGPVTAVTVSEHFATSSPNVLSCQNTIYITPGCAPSCTIVSLDVGVSQPTPNSGSYTLDVNILSTAAPNELFDVYVNNIHFGTYQLDQQPILIDLNCTDYPDSIEVRVCQKDNPHCCATSSFKGPCNDLCSIRDLDLDVIYCDTLGYGMIVDFIHSGTSSSGFDVWVGFQYYGFHLYSELPILIDAIPRAGIDHDVIQICDSDNPNCCNILTFPIPCPSQICRIQNVTAEQTPCDANGEFFFEVNFDYGRNPTLSAFHVIVNGAIIDTFLYSNNTPPIRIGPFNANTAQTYQIEIQDLIYPDCSGSVIVTGVDCNDDCQLIATAITVPCNNQGMFFVQIVTSTLHASDSFLIRGNGVVYGTFAYTNQPVTLGPFLGDGTTVREFVVIDQQNPDCRDEIHVRAPDCDNCNIWDLVVSPTGCDANDEFYVVLDFQYDNTSDSFEVWTFNHSLGNFSYDDLPVTVGPFPGNGNQQSLAVFDLQSRNCANDVLFVAPDCNAPCDIRDLIADISDCNPNGQFYVTLDFIYQGTSDSFMVMRANNTSNVGIFSYNDLPVRLGPYPGDGTDFGLLVTDLIARNCVEDILIQAPDCNTGCRIYDPVVTLGDCNSMGQFEVTLGFNYQNTSDSFTLRGNGIFYGTFAYADLPVTIDGFAGDGTTVYEFHIADNVPNPSFCSTGVEFGPLYCGDDCKIYDVHLLPQDCNNNGQFYVEVSFKHANTSGLGFIIFADGMPFGPIPANFTSDAVIIGPLDGDGTTIYDFLILDAGSPLCYAYGEVGPVDCTPCSINDLTTRVTNCNADGFFNVWIDFIPVHAPGHNFRVRGVNNNLVYGIFSYDDLPVQIGPLPGDGMTVYDLIVEDLDNPDCWEGTRVGPVDCRDDNCRISGVQASATPCTPNGIFFVDIRFNYTDVGQAGFTIRGNGQVYGTFQYNQLPVRLGPFVGDGQSVYEFVIIDNQNPDCRNHTVVGPINCSTSGCHIDDLKARPLGCNPDGTYRLWINFQAQNSVTRTFNVYTRNGLLGTFSTDQLPVIIDHFPPSGNPYDVVAVCLNDNVRCCADIQFPAPNCPSSCVEFESLVAGTKFTGSGSNTGNDTITVESGVDVTMHEFITSVMGPRRDSVKADSSSIYFDAASGISLTTYNSTVLFRFPRVITTPCSKISLDYFQLGDENNISVNGHPLRIFERFTDLPADIAPGVRLEVFPVNPREGRLVLRGRIETLRIGGENLSIDNICFEPCGNSFAVWPGDADFDNLVTHHDLLNVGVAYGQSDLARSNVSIGWSEAIAEDWLVNFGTGVNFKHADCNGDGIVSDLDVNAIRENYGRSHGDMLQRITPVPALPGSAPLFIKFPPAEEISSGIPFKAQIHVGTEERPAFNAYGIAFTMRYDPEKLRINNILFPPGWLGEPGEDVLTIDRTFESHGMVHIALTRNNQENVSGYGAMVEFIGIIDIIAGRSAVIEIDITDVTMIGKNELLQPVEIAENRLDLTTPVIKIDKGSLVLYPNPVSHNLFIKNETGLEIEEMTISRIDGAIVERFENVAGKISMSDYPSGVYTLQLRIGGEVYYQKIIKQ